MSAMELKKSPIAVPQLGPLKIRHEDWQMLVRHAKAFTSSNPESATSATDSVFAASTSATDTVFVVVSENGNPRILLLPMMNKTDMLLPDYVRMLSKTIIAFGYVRGESSWDNLTSELRNEPAKTKSSLEPTNSDVKVSVEIDKIVGRPIYYIIMNRKFEYEIYKTPMENLYGILQPVHEEPEVPEPSPPQQTGSRYAFECHDCGLKFKSIGEARQHTESNKEHKIFRLERDG